MTQIFARAKIEDVRRKRRRDTGLGLRALRIRFGFSYAGLSERLGVRPSRLSQIERSVGEPVTDGELIAILHALVRDVQ